MYLAVAVCTVQCQTWTRRQYWCWGCVSSHWWCTPHGATPPCTAHPRDPEDQVDSSAPVYMFISLSDLLSAERDVCPHCPVVERLPGPEVITQGRFLHHGTVTLSRDYNSAEFILSSDQWVLTCLSPWNSSISCLLRYRGLFITSQVTVSQQPG